MLSLVADKQMKLIIKLSITSLLILITSWSCSQASGQESSLTMILTGSMHGQLDPCG